MTRLAASAAALIALALTGRGHATPGDPTVCRMGHGDTVLSYVGGVEGFRPGETFIREWRREPAEMLVGAPRFYEVLRFNGDDHDLTYDYTLDDRQTPPPARAAEDHVHAMGPRERIGTKGYIQTFWDRDDKTLMAHVTCNAGQRPDGDCRIGFEDVRRKIGGDAEGPVVELFLDGAEPRDICADLMGLQGAWWLVLDGVKSPAVSGACGGAALAKSFTEARTVAAVMVSPFDYNKGKEVVNTLDGAGIKAARDFADYLRAVSYAPSPEKIAWLEALVVQSKAAFGKAGDAIRDCGPSEPPT